MWRFAALFVVLMLSSGCELFGRPVFTCPTGSHPCGNGCIPTAAVCCDDGSGKTSSYCTNGAAGCFPNDRGCSAVFPAGVEGQYCCGESGSIGSNDCPAGQKHCGLLCVAESESCCPAGATKEECPERSWDPGGCPARPGNVGCGVCIATKLCVSCPTGTCCQGGQVCGGPSACIKGAACTGTSTGGGGTSSQCSAYKEQCGTSGGVQSLGAYYPKTCPCPGQMKDEGGSHLNELCGLEGTGHDCKYCSCP